MIKITIKNRNRYFSFFLLSFLLVFYLFSPVLAWGAEPTTAVQLVKYETNKKTVTGEKRVDYRWMEANLPVYGDGKTFYYHQGPVFEGDKWDPGRAKNLKNKGAVKGTALKDLCKLVGGMSPGDEVVIFASDGYQVKLDYQNIYEPPDRQGPVVLCWYNGEEEKAGEQQGNGYVPSYYTGMRLVFMSKVPNAEGKYVFGNADMRDCMKKEKYWHFYEGKYPSTSGLSAKWVEEIAIFSGGAPEKPFRLTTKETGKKSQFPPSGYTFMDMIPYIVCFLILLLAGVYFFNRPKK
ncbi:MAG TPA: argininosuccinate synthase [Desulfotomaculum sp.]|nr:argininosuccinate synthase [Desulfotomaculum sp.]HCJ79109.1 argininosuccinate synthase [Desulfotomaculum sp.]